MGFKKIMLVLIFTLAILTIGSVSAVDDNSTSLTVGEDLIVESSNDEVLSTGEGTFSNLSALINNTSENGVLELDKDYINNGFESEISISKAMTIDGKGHTVDAISKSRIFNIKAEVTLKDVVLKNGYCDGEDGGAITTENSVKVSISNCTFLNNSATRWAGAIDIQGKGSSISNCTFINNSATIRAGAVYWTGKNGFLSDCRFISNSVASSCGGAIYWGADTASLSNCSFVNNTAMGDGGAIDWYGSFFTISNCSFVNNTANSSGGAITFCGGAYGSVFNCSFVNSSSIDEGGALSWGSNYEGHVSNCSFVNSSCDSNGGAIYWYGSDGTVSDCSFVNSFSNANGGAIYWYRETGSVSTCSFVNCSSQNYGGAVYWCGDEGKIEDSNFTSSKAKSGAAIYVGGNINVTISTSKFEDSVSEESEDAVYGGTVSNCNFVENNGSADSPQSTITTIQLNSSELYLGENITITVSVLDQSNQPISGNVELFINSTSIGPKTIGVPFTYAPVEMGNYIVEARFSETSDYTASSNFTSFTVISNVIPVNAKNETRTMLLVNSANVYLGDNVTVTAIVSNQNSEMLAGTVDVYVNSTFIGSKNINEAFAYAPDKIGKYIIEARFNETSDYNASSARVTVNVIENIVPEEMISDDDGIVILEFPDDAGGEVEVFIDGVCVEVVKIVNGIAVIDLSKYKGNYTVSFVYSGDENYPAFKKDVTVTIKTNPSITASNAKVIYSAGTTYKITVYKNKGITANKVNVVIKQNNKKFKTIKTNSKGIASFKVTQKPGTYKLKITSLGTTVTKTLTVKHIVTLKAVKVKKSAKKLILQATLAKVNKKYLKKKTVTFKFNGKKYKAKTNSKGVAKVTIKKSVLKKLKVGKKVTYQATYLKDTVKKTAKVKK